MSKIIMNGHNTKLAIMWWNTKGHNITGPNIVKCNNIKNILKLKILKNNLNIGNISTNMSHQKKVIVVLSLSGQKTKIIIQPHSEFHALHPW